MRSRILNNTSWILLGSAFNKASSIILLFMLSRYLGVDGFGKFSFVFLYASFFGPFAEMGLTQVLIKYVNADPKGAGAVMGGGIKTGLASTIITILAAWLTAAVLGYSSEMAELIMIGSLTLIFSFRDMTFRWILEAPFRASLKMSVPVLLGIFSELLGLFLVLLSVRYGGTLEEITALYVLSNIPGFIMLWIASRRAVRPVFTEGQGGTGLLREASPIAFSNILSSVCLLSGTIILYRFGGPEALGYYALAFRLTTSLRAIPEAIMHSVFPFIAGAHEKGHAVVNGIFQASIKYMALIAFPLAFGTMAISPSLTVLIGGEGFLPASKALSIMVWAAFFAFFNTALRFTFNALSMQAYSLRISAFMAAVSVILSFVLIPGFGFIGAALALTATEAAGLLSAVRAASLRGLTVPYREISIYLAASIGMAAGIWFLPYLPLQVFMGAVIYIGAGYFMTGFEKFLKPG